MNQLYLFSGPLCSMLIEKSSFKRLGPFWKEGKKELYERSEWDESGRIGLLEKPEYFEYWAYLKDKKKAACYRFDKKDELIYKDVYFYHDSGQQECREIYEPGKADRVILYREDQGIQFEQEGERIKGYGFNNKNQLISEYLYHGNETDLVKKYIYKDKGLVRKEEQDKLGRIISSTEYTLNEAGLILEEIQKNGSEKILYHKVFQYPRGEDANFLVREEYALNKNGRKIPLTIYYRSLNFYHNPDFREPEKRDPRRKSPHIPKPIPKETGTIPFSNGFYKGEISHDLMEGRGIFTFNDGSFYEGYFLQGKMHGKGVMVWKDGSRYEGPFTQGLMNGVGTFTWSNGDRFKGLFEQGQRTDQGLIEPAE